MKKLTSVLVILLVLALLASCTSSATSSFSVKGLTITLDTSFARSDVNGYTACFTSLLSTVYMLREEFTLFESPDTMDVTMYTEMVLANNGMQGSAFEVTQGIASFSFVQIENEVEYTYYVSLYKGNDAFWTVQFVCPSAQYESMKDSFVTWASSVTFSEALTA